MTKSAADLRALAADCAARARLAGPRRAQQLRDCVRDLQRQALRLDLFEHSKAVGRTNVTPASFREHLRTHRE